jgi:hypothetical protein
MRDAQMNVELPKYGATSRLAVSSTPIDAKPPAKTRILRSNEPPAREVA